MDMQSTTQAAITWPSGGFQWKDEWRDKLPVVRGITPVPPVPGPELFATMIELSDDSTGWLAGRLEELAKPAGRSWTYWGKDLSRERITRDNLQQRDFEFWLELFAQAYSRFDEPVDWVMHHCIGLHGLPFAMDVVFALPPLLRMTNAWFFRRHDALDLLRVAIAAAGDAEHDAALHAAEALRQRNEGWRVPCAHLFPHQLQWVLECVEQDLPDPNDLLLDCAMPVSSYVQYLKRRRGLMVDPWPSALLQVQMHGDAAIDSLAAFLDKASHSRQSTLEALELVTSMRVPKLIPVLAAASGNREIRLKLEEMASAWAPAVLKSAIEHGVNNDDRLVQGWSIRMAMGHPAALKAAVAVLDEPVRTRFDALLGNLQREPAALEDLPAVLRDPPWLRKKRAAKAPTVEVALRETEEKLEWSDQELEEAARYQVSPFLRQKTADNEFPKDLNLGPIGEKRLRGGESLRPEDLMKGGYGAAPELVLVSPKPAQLLLWNSYPASRWWDYHDQAAAPVRAILALYGVAALPGLLSYAQRFPDVGFPLMRKVDSPRFVDLASHAFRNLKKTKDLAQSWLRNHPRTVFVKALPRAFSAGAGPERENARHGVRWLAGNGHEGLAREVAAEYGQPMVEALQAFLSADSLLALPSRMPQLPAFFVPASFRRPELASGDALPLSAIGHVGSMLAISPLESPYAGVNVVKEVCSRDSLAEFAWDLFEAWLASGAPMKEGWAFSALALLGDDETARRLTVLIREWPSEGVFARAAKGLDVLAGMASDAALMHLHGIAAKVKSRPLQERAREKLILVAEARGLTAEELGDLLVPDLGLDEAGALELSFGPRTFTLRFDESLKPFVKDSQGVRLKDLPKPVKSDDAALAETATQRYKRIKKEARAIAALQVLRMEQAMVAQRRWPAVNFRRFIVEHPVMRHLAARLVWGVFADGRLTDAFRISEDLTLADASDRRYELGADAIVGIPHVLGFSKPTLDAFGQIFADYEILQPFKQLGREAYALTDAEKQSHELKRFQGRTYVTASVMGLAKRGWEAQSYSGGMLNAYAKSLGEDLRVTVDLDPGTIIGDPTHEPRQKIPNVTLSRRTGYDSVNPPHFRALDAIAASEVLRDIELLVLAKE